jgi:agmatinase
MDKNKKNGTFDPSAVGVFNGNLFGLPFSVQESQVAILPVPWDVTTSYRDGTHLAPERILDASVQVDLYDPDVPKAWHEGIAMLPVSEFWKKRNKAMRKQAKQHIHNLSHDETELSGNLVAQVNKASAELNEWVRAQTLQQLKAGKWVGLLGGEHSTPLGLMQAVGQFYGNYGILQIDAHCDLREAYEDFTYSHASIMYNALKLKQVQKLVQVGIRDYSQGENAIIEKDARIKLHDMRSLRRKQFEGKSWDEITDGIVRQLPQQVYVSFDIDGLDAALCPNTGTPVPDGLGWEEAFYLIEKVARSGRTIVAFDLCEVGVDAAAQKNAGELDSWDAIVGARALYRLACLMSLSRAKKKRG